MIRYSMIAAVSENQVIGNGPRIPWHIPEDLQLFKRLTSGNILIMGRKTFESIGKALPGRTTLVVTRSPETFRSPGPVPVPAFSSPRLALEHAATLAEDQDGEKKNSEIFIAGGAEIYRQMISGAEKLYISRVPGRYDGDILFPGIPADEWKLVSEEDHGKFRLEIYTRK